MPQGLALLAMTILHDVPKQPRKALLGRTALDLRDDARASPARQNEFIKESVDVDLLFFPSLVVLERLRAEIILG